MAPFKWPKTVAGSRYGKLVAVCLDRKIGKDQFWRFRCDCGTETVFRLDRARSGRKTSCGCEERPGGRTHGMTGSPEYWSWQHMRRRCQDANDPDWDRYGGRGIKVCDRWVKGEGGLTGFQCFLADMGRKPSPDCSIDRKDNDGHYEPGNARWACSVTQANNSAHNRVVVYSSRAMTLVQACELAGLSYGMVRTRLHRGWSIERALSAPRRGR